MSQSSTTLNLDQDLSASPILFLLIPNSMAYRGFGLNLIVSVPDNPLPPSASPASPSILLRHCPERTPLCDGIDVR